MLRRGKRLAQPLTPACDKKSLIVHYMTISVPSWVRNLTHWQGGRSYHNSRRQQHRATPLLGPERPRRRTPSHHPIASERRSLAAHAGGSYSFARWQLWWSAALWSVLCPIGHHARTRHPPLRRSGNRLYPQWTRELKRPRSGFSAELGSSRPGTTTRRSMPFRKRLG